MVPVKVQIVIAKYEGDKKVSSLPYTLSVTANGDRVSLRMGSQIPVPTTSYQGAANTTPVTTFSYHNVGTNIDSGVRTTDDGRYSVFVGIEDSSVVERRANDPVPTLRNFSTQNTVVLRDGQTMQFTSAGDKTTGEVVKVDVTLTVER
jgi:type II secretory pathway component GspD/PulD (secretin)